MGWAGVRFPNPKSDVIQLADAIRPLADDFDEKPFDLDQMRDSLATRGLISSGGATGQRAVSKSVARGSRRAPVTLASGGSQSAARDLTRDPLYNQCKMMSEVYRSLGWFRSLPGERLRFRLTNLGRTIALDGSAYGSTFLRGALRESLLGMVFPNPTARNIGVTNNRPFAWILRLAQALDGQICRDEIIIGALSVVDDLEPGRFQRAVDTIHNLRTRSYDALKRAVEDLATRHSVQVNTLRNYTRLPNGVLSSESLGWGTRTTDAGLYKKRGLPVFVLTPDGARTAAELPLRLDVRDSMLESLSHEEAVAFADHGYYSLLLRSGIPLNAVQGDLTALAPTVNPLLAKFGVAPDTPLLFNPELQMSDEVLSEAWGEA